MIVCRKYIFSRKLPRQPVLGVGCRGQELETTNPRKGTETIAIIGPSWNF